MKPTVFADVHNGMRIAREEIFGPVLSMIPFKDLDDAIAIANGTPYGLAAYLFTKVQPGLTWENAMWHCYVTSTTVGYGESVLDNELSRALAAAQTKVRRAQAEAGW